MARDFGIPDHEIEAMQPEVLDEVVYRLHKQARQILREHSIESTLQGALERQPEPEESLLKLDHPEEEYDPSLLRTLKEQAATIKRLEKRLDSVQGFQQERVQEWRGAQLDTFFESCNDEANFGKGSAQEMSADDRGYIRRVHVLNEAVRLAGPKATFKQQMSKLKQAYTNLYGGEAPPAPKPREESAEVREWREAGLARPTQRVGAPEPNGVRKAEKSVAAQLKDIGSDESGSVSHDDFL